MPATSARRLAFVLTALVLVAATASAIWPLIRPSRDVDSTNDVTAATADGTLSVGNSEPSPAHFEETALSSAERGIEVHVSGLVPGDSQVYFAVFRTSDGFPDPESSDWKQSVDSREAELRHTLRLDYRGNLAVAVFQDRDGNGRLTKNVVGIPSEPYGFSRNARRIFGPPGFEEAAVEVDDQTRLEIHVR